MKAATCARAGPKRSAPQETNLAGRQKELRLTACYHDAKGTQASFTAWQREGARLVREYLHTGREVHRFAFERHMGGMLLRARKDRA
jgi:hypothetical protein